MTQCCGNKNNIQDCSRNTKRTRSIIYPTLFSTEEECFAYSDEIQLLSQICFLPELCEQELTIWLARG